MKTPISSLNKSILAIGICACLMSHMHWALGQASRNDQLEEIRNKRIYDEQGEKVLCQYEYYLEEWSQREVKQGRYALWDKKGTTRYEANYHQNKLHGLERFFAPNGKLTQEINWVQGIKAGKTISYYRNESPKTEWGYVAGKKAGLRKKWYPNGQLKSVVIFQDGNKIGKAEHYSLSGKARQSFLSFLKTSKQKRNQEEIVGN